MKNVLLIIEGAYKTLETQVRILDVDEAIYGYSLNPCNFILINNN